MARYHCPRCCAPLVRIHRTFRERFLYYSVFECSQCFARTFSQRLIWFYFGPFACCPKCGTQSIARLRKPDRIDPLYRNVLSLAQKLVASGKLFHCARCRIQFWDRRPAAGSVRQQASAGTAMQGV